MCAPGESCISGGCVGCGSQVSYSAQVQPVFDASCTSNCHAGARPAADLDLMATKSHAALVNVAATGCISSQVRVVPGSPSTSYLMNKLTGIGMCSGTQMPSRGVSLPQAQIDLIRNWICQGAPKN
jgi:hypothetical protein